jgi:hypothetical protein
MSFDVFTRLSGRAVLVWGITLCTMLLRHSVAGAAEPGMGSTPTAITFHQFRYDKMSSEYKLDVTEDGSVVYTGIENVRQLGVHRFHVSPEIVRNTVRRLNDLRANGLEPVEGRVVHNRSHLRMSTLTVNTQGTTWSVSFLVGTTPHSKHSELRYELELAFPTAKYRCPYYTGSEDPSHSSEISGQSLDVCAFMDQGFDEVRKTRKGH